MTSRLKSENIITPVVILLLAAICPATINAQATRAKTITRVFWQDRETQQLSYADLVASDRWGLQRGWVTGFPALDAESQDLGQMQQSGGVVVIAVGADDSGEHSGGWLAIDSGVFEEPHGNHFHWKYTRKPSLTQTQLNQANGGPTRVYDSGNTLYATNSTTGGFTQIIPSRLKDSSATGATKSFPGGNGHSALAVVNNVVGYATYDNADGDDAGRVDVVNLQTSAVQPAYSFRLPDGSIHSATVSAGKLFFATKGGIYRTFADTSLSKSAETVQVNVLTSGENFDPPINELSSEDNWVIYSAGAGDSAALCMINAASSKPVVTKLPITVAEGLRLTNPRTILSLGKRFAFVFQERIDATSEVKEQLTIIELDPNRDRSFADATVRTTMPIGNSKVAGDNGHHDITFDAYGRYAIFTNPGDGVLTLLSLNDLRVRARFRVGGAPDNIIAVGAPEHFH